MSRTKVLFTLRVSCLFFSCLSQPVLWASHGYGQRMNNLCSISVAPEGLGMELSSASHQRSAPGQAVWPRFGIAISCPAPFSSATATRPGWVSTKAIPTYPESPAPVSDCLPTRPGCSRHTDGLTATTQHRRAPFKRRAVVVLFWTHFVPGDNSQSSHTGLAVVFSQKWLKS